MEWDKQHIQPVVVAEELNSAAANNGGVMFVKVMTDEQMEVLRKQIAVYATICEQLVDLHKSLASHHDLTGRRLGNLYFDPLVSSSGHKITGRQRWNPTPIQLQILERIFDEGNGAPSKQKIKEIASELTQHGQISETNVYNWFQNRRARSKRKQQTSTPNNIESEMETEVESPNEKKTKPEDTHSSHFVTTRAEDLGFQNSPVRSTMVSIDPYNNNNNNKAEPMNPSEVNSKPSGCFGQASFYETALSNSRMEQLLGKIEVPESYNPYLDAAEDYNITG